MKKSIVSLLIAMLCVAMMVGAALAEVTFTPLPDIETVIANAGPGGEYAPNRADGYLKNKFLGYYCREIATETAKTTLYLYTPETCLLDGDVAIAVLDDGADVEAFYADWTAYADAHDLAVLALAAPEGGWANSDAPALINAALGTLSQMSGAYNYYAKNVRTMVAYGAGAAAAMQFAVGQTESMNPGTGATTSTDSVRSISALALYQPVGYTFDKEKAVATSACPVMVVDGQADEQVQAFVDLFTANNGGENVTVVAEAETVPDELVSKWYRSGADVIPYRCPKPMDSEEYCGMSRGTVDCNGTIRYYWLYKPEAARNTDEKFPLIIGMNGKNADTVDYFYTSGLLELADEENVIVAFAVASPDIAREPSGVYTAMAWGRWDDTAYLQDALAPELIATQNVDASRVYALGRSSGSCMALAQAVSAGDTGNPFAAIAGCGGWLGYWEPLGFASDEQAYDTKGELFTPQNPDDDGVYTMYDKNDRFNNDLQVPTQLVYGTEDTVMKWATQAGGPSFVNPGIERMFRFYADHYKLGDSHIDAFEKATAWRDGPDSIFSFTDSEGKQVLRYTVVDGIGHVQTLNETRIAWDFLKDYSRAEDGTIIWNGKLEVTDDKNVYEMNPDNIQ